MRQKQESKTYTQTTYTLKPHTKMANTQTEYTRAFQIPKEKDWVFRQRTKKDGTPGSQTELLENNPGVTRIHVAHRDTATASTSGFDVVKLTIRGKDEACVMECYQEGRQKILASLAYDAEKAEKKKIAKQRRADERFLRAEKELFQKHAPKPEVDKNASTMVQLAEKAFQNIAKPTKEQTINRAFEKQAKLRNAFGGLELEDEHVKAQARANLKKQNFAMPTPAPAPTSKPSLSGWAKMASKAPVVKVENPQSKAVRPIIQRTKKNAPKVVEHWDAVPEGVQTGWDADW